MPRDDDARRRIPMESTVSTTKVGRTGGDAVEVIHDRERNRKRREIAKMAKDLDVREEALFVAITSRGRRAVAPRSFEKRFTACRFPAAGVCPLHGFILLACAEQITVRIRGAQWLWQRIAPPLVAIVDTRVLRGLVATRLSAYTS
jgi:hypothetical protein